MKKISKSQSASLKSFECQFGVKARAAGGIERERAVTAAEAALVSMRSSIDEYIDIELTRLQQAAGALRDGSAGYAEAEPLYQPACGLRDVGSTAGFELLTEIARNLCEVLEAMQAGARCGQDVLACHVAALQVSRQERYRGAGLDDAAELIGGLKAIASKFVPADR